MALSANSIIHYTDTLEKLKGIIQSQGFRFSYCSEKINTRGGTSFSAAIAMVSFCDIPLSDYKKHFFNKKDTGDLGYYGDYGIGLSKKWAKNHGLNPVFYLEYWSHVGTSMRKEFKNFITNYNNIESLNTHHIFLYTKNYEGELVREEIRKKDYRFYDEREWRIVPAHDQIKGNRVVLDNDEYMKNKKQHNISISTSLLRFTLEDISYFIVKTEEEVREVYETLHRVSDREILDLTAIRVLTSEQIISDF